MANPSSTNPTPITPVDQIPGRTTALPERASAAGGLGRLLQGAVGRVSRLQLLLATLVLAAVLSLAYHEIVFDGKTLAVSGAPGVMGVAPPWGFHGTQPRDRFRLEQGASVVLGEPLTLKEHFDLTHLRFPLWDASIGMGAPLLADSQSAPFEPLHLPVVLWPSALMWDIYLVGRFLLCGIATFLFARRLKLGTSACLTAAVAYALSGFFVLYSNNPFLDVFITLPLIFYAVERIAQGGRAGSALLLAIFVASNLFAGMPEASFLTLAFAGCYALFRLIAAAVAARDVLATTAPAATFAAGFAGGLALAAPAIVPFLEFLRHAFSVHSTGSALGLIADPPQYAIGLLVPYFKGPPWTGLHDLGWTGTRTWAGVAVTFLAVLGLWNRPLMRYAGWFFLGAALLGIAKIYGVPGINDFGRLPIADLTWIETWLWPVVSLSLAILAASGVDRIARGERLGLTLHLSALAVAACAEVLLWLNRPLFAPLAPESQVWLSGAIAVLALLWAALAIVDSGIARERAVMLLAVAAGAVTLLLVLVNWQLLLGLPQQLRSWFLLGITALAAIWLVMFLSKVSIVRMAAWICFAAVALELVVLVPQGIYQDRYDVFTQPPYIGFLQARQQAPDRGRVFSIDGTLVPDSAAVYGIDDIRNMDALWPARYMGYITQNLWSSASLNGFWGMTNGPLAARRAALESPLFDLLGVKFLLTSKTGLYPELSNSVIDGAVASLGSTPQHSSAVLTLQGDERPALLSEAPADIPIDLTVTPAQQVLRFSAAIHPNDWQAPSAGDGVTFQVLAAPSGASPQVVWQRVVDTAHNPDDRRWIDGSVDLKPFGPHASVILRTQPNNNTAPVFAGWGDPRLTSASDTSAEPKFRLIYDDDIRIYENADALPRAFAPSKVLLSSGADQSHALMAQPDFNPRGTAVLEGTPSKSERAVLADSTAQTGSQVAVNAYSDDRVSLTATMARPGLVVLTDTFYPGWTATVDGKPASIYLTDYAFRGVVVPEGTHEVVFSYSPASFKLGLAVGVLAAMALAGWWLIDRHHARRVRSGSAS
jgi:Bacterial membrane protein YfhO